MKTLLLFLFIHKYLYKKPSLILILGTAVTAFTLILIRACSLILAMFSMKSAPRSSSTHAAIVTFTLCHAPAFTDGHAGTKQAQGRYAGEHKVTSARLSSGSSCCLTHKHRAQPLLLPRKAPICHSIPAWAPRAHLNQAARSPTSTITVAHFSSTRKWQKLF